MLYRIFFDSLFWWLERTSGRDARTACAGLLGCEGAATAESLFLVWNQRRGHGHCGKRTLGVQPRHIEADDQHRHWTEQYWHPKRADRLGGRCKKGTTLPHFHAVQTLSLAEVVVKAELICSMFHDITGAHHQKLHGAPCVINNSQLVMKTKTKNYIFAMS